VISLKSAADLDAMRKSGRIVGMVLKGLEAKVRPGVSTLELDKWAEKLIRDQGAMPAFKGYRGFPGTLCTSVNEQVVHGIPGPRILKDGDIISVDVGVKLDGWYGDAAKTYAVGKISQEAERLMRVTAESLAAGLAQARSGKRLSDIGHAVQSLVEAAGFSVVREFVGHGVGRELWEDPQVPNYGEPNQGVRLKPGMVLAIEPMVNLGDYDVEVMDDHWTVVTKDHSLSAHFEHTVAILDGDLEVLTG
jgi:methionyl aminopeptidase